MSVAEEVFAPAKARSRRFDPADGPQWQRRYIRAFVVHRRRRRDRRDGLRSDGEAGSPITALDPVSIYFSILSVFVGGDLAGFARCVPHPVAAHRGRRCRGVSAGRVGNPGHDRCRCRHADDLPARVRPWIPRGGVPPGPGPPADRPQHRPLRSWPGSGAVDAASCRCSPSATRARCAAWSSPSPGAGATDTRSSACA